MLCTVSGQSQNTPITGDEIGSAGGHRRASEELSSSSKEVLSLKLVNLIKVHKSMKEDVRAYKLQTAELTTQLAQANSKADVASAANTLCIQQVECSTDQLSALQLQGDDLAEQLNASTSETKALKALVRP